jgi:hypothetical protein
VPKIGITDASNIDPQASLQDLTARLQRDGNRHGLGRWSRFALRDLNPRASNTSAGASVVVGGDAGSISFANIGETTLVTLYMASITTAGGVASLIMTMPEGYQLYPRDMKQNSTNFFRVVLPLAFNSVGALSTGIFVIEAAKPNQIVIYRDLLGTAYANGLNSCFGQFAYENMFQMEHQ